MMTTIHCNKCKQFLFTTNNLSEDEIHENILVDNKSINYNTSNNNVICFNCSAFLGKSTENNILKIKKNTVIRIFFE